MTRLQRRIHTWVWLVGGPLLVVALVLALALRPAVRVPEHPESPAEQTP